MIYFNRVVRFSLPACYLQERVCFTSLKISSVKIFKNRIRFSSNNLFLPTCNPSTIRIIVVPHQKQSFVSPSKISKCHHGFYRAVHFRLLVSQPGIEKDRAIIKRQCDQHLNAAASRKRDQNPVSSSSPFSLNSPPTTVICVSHIRDTFREIDGGISSN